MNRHDTAYEIAKVAGVLAIACLFLAAYWQFFIFPQSEVMREQEERRQQIADQQFEMERQRLNKFYIENGMEPISKEDWNDDLETPH